MRNTILTPGNELNSIIYWLPFSFLHTRVANC